MNERQLQGAGLLLLVFLAAAFVLGAGWRSASFVVGHGVASAEPGAQGARRAEARQPIRHVVIPQGWRAEQIAGALESAGIGSGARFMSLVTKPGRAKLRGSMWAGVRSLEGYLYPGVYDVGPDFSEESLVGEMTKRFEAAFSPSMRGRARELGLSVREVLTLASIVQREMVFASEAPVIAAVYHNRLKAGRKLQADPTVIYALESVENEVGDRYWRRGLGPRSLQFDSPYNTYRRAGLPPGPIASPSLDAITAVLYPADLDYLFFVARGNNTHLFARTYREHLGNVERYRAGRAQAPGAATDLQWIVERVMAPVRAHVGVIVKNLATGEAAYLNSDEFFTAASLYKLAVMWKAFDEREKGRLSFGERLPISLDVAAKDVAEVRARLGTRPTVRKAIREMIVVSSNAAGVTLLRRLGRQRIDQFLHEQGLRETSLSSARLVTTPRDVARLLELVATGRAVSGKASSEMVEILLRQRIRDRLPKYLPKRVRLAHKTGNIDYPSHDAGILYGRRGPIVIVAMTESPRNAAKAAESIAELGRVVFDYFESYRPAAERASEASPGCPSSPFRPRARGGLSGKTIVLDPGHGGTDPGGRFAFRDGFVLKEKDVVLDVALRLRDLLAARGATVHMTRCRDVFVPRMVRAALANAIEPDVVVSVHVNASPKPRKDGTELYYFQPNGKVLANYLLGTFARPALWETLSAGRALPNRGVLRRQFDVLTFSLAPTALTESLFLTNPAEAAALRETHRRAGSRRQQIARGHLLGILNYFGVADSPKPRPALRRSARGSPPADTVVRIAATGDIAMGSTPVLPLDGGAGLFSRVSPHLTGDVVLGNLEGTLALGGDSKCGSDTAGSRCYAFRTPPWYAYWLKRAGFTVLNLANNHSYDFGSVGASETISALDGAALLHTGRPGQIARQQVGPVLVAVIGFAPYPWAQNVLDISAARRLVRRADAWADLVLVTMHAGGEGRTRMHVLPGPETYLGEPRGDPLAFAHAVVDAGADLVVGHGPHVLRGMEWYHGRLIAYSLGNFAGHDTFSLRGPLGLGGILQVTLRADGSWAGGRLVATRLIGTGRPVPDRGETASRLLRALSREDFGRRAVGITPAAELLPPADFEPDANPRAFRRHGGRDRVAKPRALPPVRELDIVAGGDLLIHGPIARRAYLPQDGSYDFRPMFAEIRPLIRRAALAICHVETPIGAGRPSGFPRFNAPTELAEAIKWAGWDICGTASNHSVDMGQLGIETTAHALDRAGVAHTGAFRSPSEARRILISRVRGLNVAVLAYTYGTNGIALPHPWSLNLISIPKIVADAKRARRLGADLLVANFHWGDEYVHAPNSQQRALARYLLKRRIVDVILGQHAHVVQPIRTLFGRFVVFGEGNLLSNQTAACCPPESQDGLVAVVHVRAAGRRATVTGVDYVPIRVRHPDFVVEPVGFRVNALVAQGRGATALARELRDSYERTVRFVGRGPNAGPLPSRLRGRPVASATEVAHLSPREKAALVVVSGLPAPKGVGGVIVGRWNRHLPRPEGTLVFADQEGGDVKAMPDLPPWQAASSYTSSARAFAEGRATARALRRSGVHFDLAPVLDSSGGPLGPRHFRDPAFAVAFARGLAAGGAGACAKHFPGLGSTPVSTDVARVRGVVPAGELRGFRSAIRTGVPCVMVGHAIYARLGRRPASLEPATYRLLRRAGFEGVAITDDLDVLGRSEAARSARLAIEAGADLVLFTSGEDAERAIEALVPLARRGLLDDSVARVLRLRRSFGVWR